MRLFVLFLIGLAVGALGTLAAVNALNRHTPWNKATMTVMAHQMKAIDENAKANKCAATDIVPHVQTLRLVANDIEAAFGDEFTDPQFGRYAADLRGAADVTLATPPATCKAVQDAMDRLGKACDSCHRDFRS
jgi:hypothetical protein